MGVVHNCRICLIYWGGGGKSPIDFWKKDPPEIQRSSKLRLTQVRDLFIYTALFLPNTFKNKHVRILFTRRERTMCVWFYVQIDGLLLKKEKKKKLHKAITTHFHAQRKDK